ncbi:MAG: DUF2779 domain-containing protein [Ardenticatenaceae bacterium]|nr:DUF2779 domain-containing protein [Ardenticatenaceae bacterium]
MAKNNQAKARDVRTTILTVDRQAIDWERLQQNCHIVRYKMPYRPNNDKSYYARMHVWYKHTSNFPCFLQMQGGQYLYVQYDTLDKIVDLSYEGRLLPNDPIDLQDEQVFPQILKLLLADFFQVDGRFVSNADFFLWATADKDFVTGLKIDLKHNWEGMRLNYGQNDEFRIDDQAARLRKLRLSDFDELNDKKRKNKVYYGRFYMDDMAVFKQLKPDQLTRAQLKKGIYELFEGSVTNRASLTFHSVKSLDDLQQTRSYLLNQFIGKFVTYLNERGLPFQQKALPMQSVQKISTAKMKQRQLPSERSPIYIVDDRINANRQPDDFATRFCQAANEAISDHDTLFIVKAEADLQPGDRTLRIQDYDGDEFDPETGILKDWQDTKADFYARHPAVVKHTFNVNYRNSQQKQRDAQLKKSSMSVEKYLDYSVPKAKDSELINRLEVIRNQLILKGAIAFPKNVSTRLPQVANMGEMIFLYKEALVYFDDGDLHFMTLVNNFDEASALVQNRTGWDLMDDVFFPSANLFYYNGVRSEKERAETAKRPFIISRDFVWEIWEKDNGRVLHEDAIIQQRLATLEEPISTKKYYPTQPIEDTPPFTAQQLQDYAAFLDQYVLEPTISYLDLKKQYGKLVQDNRGNIIAENGGFYALLGIKNETKFKRYLNEHLGFSLESIREDQLFPIYKGIWYAPNTNHYVAGVKDTNQGEQERGHTLRRIVVHRGERDSIKLQNQLKQWFFPLLEVNFIRHRNYTVVPFPFRLIEMWKDITSSSSYSKNPALAKTAYLAYSQCPKRFWLAQYQPRLAAPSDAAAERRFRIGQEVDELAQGQFSSGRLIPHNIPLKEAVQLTAEAIAEGAETLLQATFAIDDLLVRADILTQIENGWKLIEVKSTSGVKPEHLTDLAFQAYVLGKMGIEVKETAVLHLNSDCQYPDFTNLFALTDVTADTQPLLAQIPNDIDLMRQTLTASQPPDLSIGRHCTKSHTCPFYDHCWQDVEGPTIYDIPRLSEERERPLQEANILHLADIPADAPLTTKQREFVDFFVQEQINIDHAAIQQALAELEYPLYFLDFETIDYAIPRFDGCKPFQQIPFQYSCHILDADGNLTHCEYLHTEADDPRRPLIDALLKDIGDQGSIIVFYAPFERKRLQELAEAFPDHTPRLLNMVERLWDQLDIFKKHYRDYRFGKSNSLKSILPIIVPELSYEALSVQDGTQAQVVWEEMISKGNTAVKSPLAAQLREYCLLDTLAMVEIHRVLANSWGEPL